MALVNEILAESNGAHFLRADLHIHSFGDQGSYDVKDAAMTSEGIIDAAIKENLKVVAIADHNAIGNIQRAVNYAKNKDVLVVPAIEVSTQQGHLLIYFPTPANLEGFFGKLQISADRKVCHNTMAQCLEFAEAFGGFGILAHVDREAGLELTCPKFDAFKQDILNRKNLLGMEITDANNSLWFSHLDSDPNRKNCAKIRRETLGHESDIQLAKVMGSDSHAMNALGRNAQGNKRLTRFKMESLSFDALRIALLDGAARVRLEELIPQSIPHFVGMKLEGGFLDDQVVNFSKNLTCIIGGRGAGKSTLLESLCVACGNGSDNALIDSEVWPDCISLIFEDEIGTRHTLTRAKLGDVTNEDPDGPVWVSIENYGQGKTASTIHDCDKDPAILLAFLDGFLNLEELKTRDEELRDELLANQTEIEKLHQEVVRIPDIEQAKKVADGQLAVLKTQQAAEVVDLEQKLASERIFRTKLRNNLDSLLKSINEGLNSDELKELIDSMDGSGLAVGISEFEAVQKLAKALADDIDSLSSGLKAKVKNVAQQISAQLDVWVAKEKETRDAIEEIRRELAKQKITLDIAFIRKVTKDASEYATKLADLKKLIPKKNEAYKRRSALIRERRELKSKIFTTRESFAVLINQNLRTCVVDYSVHLKFKEGVLSKELENIVRDAMGWRTAAVPKATVIATRFSPMTFLDVIDNKEATALTSIVDQDGNKVFTAKEAADILEKLGQWVPYVAIQRCLFEDRPEIKVTKPIELANGKKVFRQRDFAKLSLGQQQSILLTILLFSRSSAPLIIDQPEDNLDSEFVYTTLVRSLRAIKEQRQVIVVTHNPNIAVLGDAELIIPLRGAAELSVIRDRGSIDTKRTKDIVCTILEGSPKAFLRRYEMYGY
jgi:ABC-type cobalamin/Fe3+-siderophores transport system ATPase subunit